MNRRERTHQALEREIRQEKAAALGRAGERLEEALAAMQEIARRLDAATDSGTASRLLDEYEAARGRANTARLALVVQREALGLRHHALVDTLFPVLPRRRPGPARPD